MAGDLFGSGTFGSGSFDEPGELPLNDYDLVLQSGEPQDADLRFGEAAEYAILQPDVIVGEAHVTVNGDRVRTMSAKAEGEASASGEIRPDRGLRGSSAGKATANLAELRAGEKLVSTVTGTATARAFELRSGRSSPARSSPAPPPSAVPRRR